MSKQHSIAEARSKLPQLVREAEAVLIGRKQHERLVSRSRRFSEAFAEFVSEIDLVELDINPDEVFAGIRDDTAGRVAPAPRVQ